MDHTRIKQVHKTKYIGLTVDDKLCWDENYKSVKGKVVGGLASIRKLKNILPQSQLLNVYQALVESHLRYANVIWGTLSDTKISTLQKYQNRALDLIESSKMKDAWNKNLMNITQLTTFDRAVMTYKIFNQLCPEGLQNKFIKRSVISKYTTRNRRDLHVQKLKLVFCTLAQLLGIISHSPLEIPIPSYDLKKTKISPLELTESAPHESMEDQAIYFNN